jgi:3-oxoacyl-[acyl-carrier-protein] synthase II
VLAGEDTVEALGLTPGMELAGFGNTLDAYKITAPDPSGKGIKRALQEALSDAGIAPGEVDYINLHGTGTRNNDGVELDSLEYVFGDAFKNVALSSTKDRHGHAIAAAGIQEFAILCECMNNDLIPCNLNLEKPISQGEADLVQYQNREKEINIGMTVNFAFGGVNTALVVRKA